MFFTDWTMSLGAGEERSGADGGRGEHGTPTEKLQGVVLTEKRLFAVKTSHEYCPAVMLTVTATELLAVKV